MLTRIISVVLIAAVIACPMWCGSGVCHTGRCCAADGSSLEKQDSYAVCSVHGKKDCGCEKSSRDNDEHGPNRCPGNGLCQGVCGGAVFEKPFKLDGPYLFSFLLLIDSDDSNISLLADYRTVGTGHHHCLSPKNHGRFMRMLHSSFLC